MCEPLPHNINYTKKKSVLSTAKLKALWKYFKQRHKPIKNI